MEINADVAMYTASAPKAIAFATSAPDLIPPAATRLTSLLKLMSLRASSAFTIASIVGIPACSVTTSGPAPVPPCIPSTTIISAPALAAIFTSCSTLPDANFTMIGIFQSVISLN